MQKFGLFLFLFFVFSLGFSQAPNKNQYENYIQPYIGIGNLIYFEQAYPDLIFKRRFDLEEKDWIVSVIVPTNPGEKDEAGKEIEFYWANGSLLPKSELENKDKYWSLLYSYSKTIEDPEKLSDEEREQIKKFSATENRQEGAGTPMFFFDAVYDSGTRRALESNIVRISFLGKLTNVHKRVKEPLKNVEKKINILAETDEEVKKFISNLKSCDGYYWRIIEGTNRKSFHSIGIALDILPKSQEGKQIFWSWAKSKYPETWMLIPLKKRWMPPESVIKIFEEEGFIWGGKWIIFDNMHFEYHPELIKYNFR